MGNCQNKNPRNKAKGTKECFLIRLRKKRIAKMIVPYHIEFEDGEKIELKNLDYKLIKSLIWW